MDQIRAWLMNIHTAVIRNHESVTVYTAVAATVIGLAGFTLTFSELINANHALKASNAYQIQRDARQLLERHIDDNTYERKLHGDDEIDDEFKKHVWIFFNFYLSVFRQQEMGGLTNEFANSYKADFCDYIRNSSVIEVWDEFITQKKIGISHKEMRSAWCPCL